MNFKRSKRMKKLMMMAMMALAAAGAGAGEVKATAITAKQRYPWNGLVDITVTLEGASNDVAAAMCWVIATNRVTGTEVAVNSLERNGETTGSGTTWTRRFIWNASADLGEVVINQLEITPVTSFGVQLWENGPYWAELNVGASTPVDYGYYFWWVDTVGYKRN